MKYWQIERPNRRNLAVLINILYPECHHMTQEQTACLVLNCYIPGNLRKLDDSFSAQKKIFFKLRQLEYILQLGEKRQRNSNREWREMTPCPVSWWAVKGPERESQLLLPPCLALSLLSGLFFWELPRNWSWEEMTVVVREQLRLLNFVQARKSPAEAGKGEKLGPLSRQDLTVGWKCYMRPF